jgi:hypothetical protein
MRHPLLLAVGLGEIRLGGFELPLVTRSAPMRQQEISEDCPGFCAMDTLLSGLLFTCGSVFAADFSRVEALRNRVAAISRDLEQFTVGFNREELLSGNGWDLSPLWFLAQTS